MMSLNYERECSVQCDFSLHGNFSCSSIIMLTWVPTCCNMQISNVTTADLWVFFPISVNILHSILSSVVGNLWLQLLPPGKPLKLWFEKVWSQYLSQHVFSSHFLFYFQIVLLYDLAGKSFINFVHLSESIR